MSNRLEEILLKVQHNGMVTFNKKTTLTPDDCMTVAEAKQALQSYIDSKIIEARIETAINAMAIALYWLEEDGRPKHLVQDLWDTIDAPEVLDHIDKKWFEEARGHFNDQLTALNHRKDKDE